jgi:DNA-binding MarR family transcriptional regulator
MLAQLGRGATELYRTALAGTGLKPPHVATLIQLRSEPVGQQALSDATGIDAVKLVGILNDLETAALVERRRDLVDRRRHIVAITGAGRARLDDVERAAAAADARLLAGLTPVQREQLAALLRLVIQSSQVAEPCPGLAAAQAEGAGDESACGSD